MFKKAQGLGQTLFFFLLPCELKYVFILYVSLSQWSENVIVLSTHKNTIE